MLSKIITLITKFTDIDNNYTNCNIVLTTIMIMMYMYQLRYICCISYKFHLIRIEDCKLVTGTHIWWYLWFVSNLCLEWMCKEPLGIVFNWSFLYHIFTLLVKFYLSQKHVPDKITTVLYSYCADNWQW